MFILLENKAGFLDYIFSFNNPLIYVILIGIIIFAFLYFNFFHFYLPSKQKQQSVKKDIEYKERELLLKQKQLEVDNLKIFAELYNSDPNAIIRADKAGEISYKNRTAEEFFSNVNNIFEIISVYRNVIENIIEENLILEDKVSFCENYFLYYLRGIKLLDSVQITFFNITERHNYQKRLRRQKNKYKNLTLYLQNSLEKEKQRIGMELHDNICQDLTLLKMNVNNNFDNGTRENNKENFNLLLDGTISELRDIIFDLKPKMIEDLGLYSALVSLVEKVSKAGSIIGTIDYYGEIKRMDIHTETYIFRIIQECFNNILKHSGANNFKIELSYEEHYLQVLISDNGKGFEMSMVNNTKSYGLLNMNQRVKALSGKLSINSSQNGTNLIIKIPYKI